VRSNGGWQEISIEVVPLNAAERPHFLILFEPETPRGRKRAARLPEPPPRAPAARSTQQVAALQQELASSREYLQSIIQELEAANEELQSANEEVLSANEELQSTNEELDTAKEELQSTNEELNTVNEELHGRNEELARLNSDLLNLLASVNIAIVIVTNDLRIRRFTPIAERVLNLLPADIGRPIGHIKPNIDCPDLEELTLKVIDTVTPTERDVNDRQGRSYSLRIRPYKNVENRIEGAVLTLFDVEPGSEDERLVHRIRESIASMIDTVKQPLALLDEGLRVHGANEAFRRLVGVDSVAGRALDELANGRWDASTLRSRLERMVREGQQLDGFEVVGEGADGGSRTLVLRGRRIASGDGGALLVLTVEEREERPGAKRGR
jgi:two-component system CheB/CheR fusion protein